MAGTGKTFSQEKITEALSPLFKASGLKLVLLFGSALTGGAHKRSDLDLAFLFDGPADVLGLTNSAVRLLRTDNIDVVDLRRASPLLRYSIVRTGKVLYERSPGIFNEFCSLAFRVYVDTKKLRDARAEGLGLFLKQRLRA
ncbi:MAG: nucleotidyltransferase domain-containing protein [Thermodesulfovibrionales bacterium]|nr:nucleotidyltransferase domain-containing protein [Thermodesulfovibrionales bacterium]